MFQVPVWHLCFAARFIAPKLGCPPLGFHTPNGNSSPTRKPAILLGPSSFCQAQRAPKQFRKKIENIKWIGEVSIWTRFFYQMHLEIFLFLDFKQNDFWVIWTDLSFGKLTRFSKNISQLLEEGKSSSILVFLQGIC